MTELKIDGKTIEIKPNSLLFEEGPESPPRPIIVEMSLRDEGKSLIEPGEYIGHIQAIRDGKPGDVIKLTITMTKQSGVWNFYGTESKVRGSDEV